MKSRDDIIKPHDIKKGVTPGTSNRTSLKKGLYTTEEFKTEMQELAAKKT